MNKGFSLVELIAVIVILGLLIIITTPAYDTISKNIQKRNYESKKSTIKSQTLSFVDKHMKDEVYSGAGDKNKKICLTVNFLIRNGIIASDSDEDEYILNDIDNTEYKDNTVYLQVLYDYKNLKLVALAEGESKKIYDDADDTKDITFKFKNAECNSNNTY